MRVPALLILKQQQPGIVFRLPAMLPGCGVHRGGGDFSAPLTWCPGWLPLSSTHSYITSAGSSAVYHVYLGFGLKNRVSGLCLQMTRNWEGL